MPDEVEIKFLVDDVATLEDRLRALGFDRQTPPTHEINTLYDTSRGGLRKSGQLLRLRKYGEIWTLTHKARGRPGKHKTRSETETQVTNGENMNAILLSLGYLPSFRYEKFRAEWEDAEGHVLVDQTPIGNLAEIEGPPDWIDATAERLGVDPKQYITKNYADLFNDWKRRTHSSARAMTFVECGTAPPGQRDGS
ncbi:MAG TPA: class IV adenylate cyclase [Terriglobales bacterium]|nr:class IV adenylate cyclase [Terriglobales bacterium]